ncbi:small RNA 2'-O-methyltransferase isoform X2 [Drosophila grimshawi]|uniref:small RNA 2'-O-methyltransferase isoform X2 n=1 Tax=Drosophila grimshawi TaxID=7222 RepID=UPI000C86F599|nr:small RNA 2'-O-methyltransferase isoform X2 [Drosophila grimshawi]
MEQAVDIDHELLRTYLSRINPLCSDYLRQRQSPLHVEVLQGSVADSAVELRNTDAVIALELIEHVYDDVLSKIPINIFGFMQPKIVIFSTPNSDFNIIFTRLKSLLSNGFRHHDHKFEWTREEFKNWCLGITEKYPNYMFSVLGVGEPPAGLESVGHVSQIALFVRKDMLGMPLMEPLTLKPLPVGESPYKILHAVDFPFYKDTRSLEEKIWVEVQSELHSCTLNEANYDDEKCAYKMSIALLLKRLEHMGATRNILDQLLAEHKKQIENDFVLIEEEENDSNNSESNIFAEEEDNSIKPVCETEEENWDT